jgi:hypothetical protein
VTVIRVQWTSRLSHSSAPDLKTGQRMGTKFDCRLSTDDLYGVSRRGARMAELTASLGISGSYVRRPTAVRLAARQISTRTTCSGVSGNLRHRVRRGSFGISCRASASFTPRVHSWTSSGHSARWTSPPPDPSRCELEFRCRCHKWKTRFLTLRFPHLGATHQVGASNRASNWKPTGIASVSS